MMKKFIPVILILYLFTAYLFTAADGPCAAEETDRNGHADSFFNNFTSREYMTGSWGGFRDRLIEWGLRPTATYGTAILGNPVGGEKKGIRYAGLFNLYLDFDLEKLLGAGGTRFVVSGSWASGQSLSEEDIGNLFTVSSFFSGRAVRLYQLFLETNFWNKRVTAALGRMSIANDFSTAEVFNNYVSEAFNVNPISLEINIPAYFANPDATWASRVKVRPADDFYIASGVYNSNPRVGRDSAHGVDFSFRDGVILIAEAGYTPDSEEDPSGLRGGYKFGAFYDTRKFDELADTEEGRKGNYGFYVVIDQMLYREAETESQGFTAWATVTLASQEEINTIPFFLSWGFVYEGLFPGRGGDKAAFGMAYGAVSDDLEGKDFEIALEGTYIFQISRWLDFQPDIQYIVHPGGSASIQNSLVLGVMLSVDL